MTNKEKIARIEQMHKEATEMVAYCQKQMAEGDTSWTLPYSIEVFKQDAAALKYALKGLRLMQELVNDEHEGLQVMTVEQGLRAEFHDRPKVLARALRAAWEQGRIHENWINIKTNFTWSHTKEGRRYWDAIFCKEPNPDQYLPEGYVDVKDKGGEQ